MKTFIINVSTNELRRNHMLGLISRNACLNDSFFVHEGDLEMISPDILEKYFGGQLSLLTPAVSCAYKHILVYQEILKSDIDIALILEDDIFLHKQFCERLQKIVSEIKQRNLQNFLASLEDSNLKYIEGSKLEKNINLYKKSTGRMTGAYLVDKAGANSLLLEIGKNKCNFPIDWFHNFCSGKGLIDIYWAHPALATQGTLTGQTKSLIDNNKYGLGRRLAFSINRTYKKILYRLR